MSDILCRRAFSDEPVSSQLFAICCIVVTHRRVSSLILQSDGDGRFSLKTREVSSESIHMLSLQLRRWSDRLPRMLVFMLGVMLPAAALVVAGVWHLRTIQRDKAIEAVFQREYQQVLAIAEKRINERAYEMAEDASAKFPDAKQGNELEGFLAAHPDIAHAFLWTGKGHLKVQSQPDRMGDAQFEEEGRNASSMVGRWFDVESKDWIAKLKKIKATEGRRVYLTDNWVQRGDKWQYQSLVLFVPRGSTAEHPAFAGFVYDTDYLANKFFPQALNEVLPNQNANDTSHPQPVIMVRTMKDHSPLAASICWDGGSPEVEHGFESGFPGLILGIKLRGTTIATISNNFARTAYISLGALSLLMGGGMLLAYRSVARELALASLVSVEPTAQVIEAVHSTMKNDKDVVVQVRAATALAGLTRSADTDVRRQSLTELTDFFRKYRADGTRSDKEWGWREVGNAINSLGPDGDKALRQIMADKTDQRLADLAWRVLYLRQGDGFHFVTEEADREAHAKHPTLKFEGLSK